MKDIRTLVIFIRSSQQDLFNTLGSMYIAVMLVGSQNCLTVQPVVDVERTVFYREKAAGMYSPIPYAFAQVRPLLIIFPTSLLAPLLKPFNIELELYKGPNLG